MTRVFICEEWIPDKRYHRIEFCTDSAIAADRWRRNGVRGHERRFVDYICYTQQEIEDKGLLIPPEGVNDWSGKEQMK